MRFTILLTLCVLGVASAGSLNKRGLAEDLQSQSQNALKAFQDFSEQAKHNAEEALNKLMDFFKQFNKKPEAAEEKTVEKRDLAEEIQKLTGQAKANFEKNVKALQDFFAQFNKKSSEPATPVEAEAEVVVEKRDLAENIQKLTGEAKKNFENNLKAIMDFFAQFNKQSAPETSAPVEAETEVVVEKRDLAENIQKLTGQAKANFEKNVKALQDFFAQFNKKSSEPATPVETEAEAEVVVEKRDLAENIQKLTGEAKKNFENNLKAIMDFFAQFNKQPEAAVESEAETVVKRDVREEIQNFLADAQNKAKDAGGNFLKDARAKLMQAVQQFLKDAQTKAANVGVEVQKVIDQLFAVAEKKVEESQNVVKRDVQSDIQNFLKDAQTKAQNAGENFLKDARTKVMSALQKFLADAQNKTQNVGAEIQKAIDSFFAMAEKKVGAPEVPAQAA